MASKLAEQAAEDDWRSRQRQNVIVTTQVTEGPEARVVVDWNAVRVAKGTDVVITPMSDNRMANLLGIPVDERDRE